MLDEAIAFCNRNMRTQTIIDQKTGKRNDKTEYPINAIREAILNALIHRLSEASDKRCYEKKNIMRSRTRKFFFLRLLVQ